MRFSILSLFLVLTVVALAIALILAFQRDELVLVGTYADTWEFEKVAVNESAWVDKSESPKLSLVEAFEIGTRISKHLDSHRENTAVGGWDPVAMSLERIGTLEEDNWAYVIRLQGVDYPEHAGQSVVTEIAVMALMDGTIIFDSGSYADSISSAMMAFPEVVDASPKVNARPTFEGGIF